MKIFFALALVTCSVVLAVSSSDESDESDGSDGGSSTSSRSTTKNVAIPKPGTACKSKITFPVKALKGVKGYPLMVEVFGIPIIFGSKFKNSGKVNHIASVMAELLDQDGDGCADDPNVLRNILIKSDGLKNAMVVGNNQAIGVTTAASNAINKKGFEEGQDLYFAEVIPKCSGLNFTSDCSKPDASIEEQFHFITTFGYKKAYSKIFSTTWNSPSNLTKAMDIARGKRVKKTPKKQSNYPKKAWSRYADTTCKYGCQATEYLWWGYCSYSGTCAGRSGNKVPILSQPDSVLNQWEKEFKLLKKTQLAKTDKPLYKLFDASAKKTAAYRLATKPVDGTYTGCKKCLRKGGKSHGGK